MTSKYSGLACPHCSSDIPLGATTCPGCGAVKKMVGGGPSKKSVMVTDIVAALVGGAVGVGIRYYFFPLTLGIGDYVSAGALGAAVAGYLMFQGRGSPMDEKPMAIWEKPQA